MAAPAKTYEDPSGIGEVLLTGLVIVMSIVAILILLIAALVIIFIASTVIFPGWN